MRKKINFCYVVVLLLVASVVYSCANRGLGPQGGPKDEAPPSVLKSVPENGALNFQKKEILVDFDENISLEKVSDQVIISPPQLRNPDIRAQGKRLVVRFEDDYTDSTTYTINFGDAIVDLNEKNPVRNYRFSFSTGDFIDTLGVSGYVINAEDLNPVAGVIVGIYAETADSVFQQKPFLRVGKTNSDGFFTIDNMKPGHYQIFALGDNSRDYFFQPGEGLAMSDSLITPSAVRDIKSDTIWTDTTRMVIDTIHVKEYTRLLPDDILLRFFREGKRQLRLIKSERLRPEKFTLFFSAPQKELPQIEPLNFDWDGKYVVERNNTLDTLSYWLTDSAAWQLDTLEITLNYFKTDSVYQLIPATDTLSVGVRKTTVRTRNKKDDEPKAVPLNLATNVKSTMEIYAPIVLKLEEPLIAYDTSKVALFQRVDTILTPITYQWEQSDSTQMSYTVDFDRQPEMSYEIQIDSAAFVSVYDKVSNAYKESFKIRSLEEYSEIKIVLTDFDPRAVIQVLDTKDVAIDTKPAEEGGTLFRHLKPADYYVRLFIDENGNGIWDTGDLNSRRQPEEVFYFPTKLTLKANFEFTEMWNHKEKPLLKQKPKELQQAGKKRN